MVLPTALQCHHHLPPASSFHTPPRHLPSKRNLYQQPLPCLLSSVQFSHSVMSNFATPWTAACQDSLSIAKSRSLLKLMSIESVIPSNHLILCRPFSSCLQSFPASGSFQMSQLFISGGQRIGVSASTSVLPMNIQDWFPLGLTGWISLQSKGLSRVFSNTKSINSLVLSFLPSHLPAIKDRSSSLCMLGPVPSLARTSPHFSLLSFHPTSFMLAIPFNKQTGYCFLSLNLSPDPISPATSYSKMPLKTQPYTVYSFSPLPLSYIHFSSSFYSISPMKIKATVGLHTAKPLANSQLSSGLPRQPPTESATPSSEKLYIYFPSAF